MGSHNNCFRSYASETNSHIRKKFEVWLRLLKEGCLIYTEGIFLNGNRCDILAIFPDGRVKIIEIIESETEEECIEKVKKYPEVDDILIIKEINEDTLKDVLC
jgi:hypothetical protein